MTQFDPQKADTHLTVSPTQFSKTSDLSSSACLCKTPIPKSGTHRFTVKYTKGTSTHVLIGIVTPLIHLSMSLFNKHCWSYGECGHTWMNGWKSERAGARIEEGSVVSVEGSVGGGVVRFLVEGVV